MGVYILAKSDYRRDDDNWKSRLPTDDGDDVLLMGATIGALVHLARILYA